MEIDTTDFVQIANWGTQHRQIMFDLGFDVYKVLMMRQEAIEKAEDPDFDPMDEF